MPTINSIILSIVLLALAGCTRDSAEFDRQCRSGWQLHHKASREIQGHLSKLDMRDYIALKGGNGQGNYSFNILALGRSKALILFASDLEIQLKELPLAKGREVLSGFSEHIFKLKAYTGSGENFSHLVCEYVRFQYNNKTHEVAFYNHILLGPSDPDDPGNSLGRLITLRQQLVDLLDGKGGKPQISIAISPDTSVETMGTVPKVAQTIFYEIPY